MKKFFALFFMLSAPLFGYPKCSKELSEAVHAIYSFPEGKKLLAEAEAEGPIQIYRAPFNSVSSAMWVPQDRAIVLNANTRATFGETIRSIFFELHNATSNTRFIEVDSLAQNRKITKTDYVERVERIEHENAYSCASKISRAIQQGYFPHDSWWPIPPDFDTHFRVQKQSGHSAKIAATYDALSYQCYHGYSQQRETR